MHGVSLFGQTDSGSHKANPGEGGPGNDLPKNASSEKVGKTRASGAKVSETFFEAQQQLPTTPEEAD